MSVPQAATEPPDRYLQRRAMINDFLAIKREWKRLQKRSRFRFDQWRYDEDRRRYAILPGCSKVLADPFGDIHAPPRTGPGLIETPLLAPGLIGLAFSVIVIFAIVAGLFKAHPQNDALAGSAVSVVAGERAQ